MIRLNHEMAIFLLFLMAHYRAGKMMSDTNFRIRFPGGKSEWEPPDSISDSEVNTLSAEGSAAFAQEKRCLVSAILFSGRKGSSTVLEN